MFYDVTQRICTMDGDKNKIVQFIKVKECDWSFYLKHAQTINELKLNSKATQFR